MVCLKWLSGRAPATDISTSLSAKHQHAVYATDGRNAQRSSKQSALQETTFEDTYKIVPSPIISKKLPKFHIHDRTASASNLLPSFHRELPEQRFKACAVAS